MADSSSSAQPQSMEEILASIKRIIDEPVAVAPAADETDDEVLELGTPAAIEPVASTRDPISSPARADADAPALVSAATREASARAMAALAAVTLDPHAPPNTLDGLVRELLRPMLKDWLDANLPDLVERVVAREVARLGGR